jgi:hypothetical protein
MSQTCQIRTLAWRRSSATLSQSAKESAKEGLPPRGDRLTVRAARQSHDLRRRLRCGSRIRGRKPPTVASEPACVIFSLVNSERLDALFPAVYERRIQSMGTFRTLASDERHEGGCRDEPRRPGRAAFWFPDQQHPTKAQRSAKPSWKASTSGLVGSVKYVRMPSMTACVTS